ncbi:MAG: DPP IV N-terminal domain-containing protein [Thermoflexales bacterium]|nr:DPP IV N-terminal domain-containing protein [Thermoflexales bacterium]
MRKVKLSIFLSLVVIAVSIGLVVGREGLLRAVEGPTPTAMPAEPVLPEIPMPTVSPIQGVLATLPPVEVGKLVQLPPVLKAKILYSGSKSEREGGYYLLDPETGEEIRLEPFPPDQGGGAPGATMRVSPTGEWVLYTLFNNLDPPEHLGIGSVWRMKPDGSDKQMLTGSDELSYPANAIWSPDGKRIAYLRFPDPEAVREGRRKSEEVELWVMNADGSEQRRVALLPFTEHIFGTNNSMQWLLDDCIYIVTGITTQGEWLRINPHDGEVTRLLEGIQPWDIVLSPDTRWILVSGAMTEEKIRALGRQPLRLPSVPAWDRTGERVAFVQFPYPYDPQPNRDPGVWVYDLRTGQETRLTMPDGDTPSRYDQLVWSPDGGMLLCDTIEGLYVLEVENKAARLVVPNPWAKEGIANIHFVGWVPVLP